MMAFHKLCIHTIVLVFLFSSIPAATSQQTVSPVSRVIVVDPSGNGSCFKTIQAAIDSVPSDNQNWTRIDIKKGVYWEQVRIPREKPYIFLKGEGMKRTFIVYNGVDNIVTSATFASEANNTLARGITFANSYNSRGSNKPVARAVAARIQGDKSAFFRCGFTSVQDTLWDVEGRHYFKECTIRGAIDFIFGAGQSLYERCTISVAPLSSGFTGFITAQSRSSPEETSGFMFKQCSIVGEGKAFLGRPWRDYARVVFYDTQMSDAVAPQGWGTWDKNTVVGKLTMVEYDSYGPGANRLERVKWEKKMSDDEVLKLVSMSFIDDDGWVKMATDSIMTSS